MSNFPKTLKDPRTCRVFVSSPFGGFEKEREELVLKYFPQLSHLCQSKGVQFVAVDMRWGITEEAATDAQVVSICLREIDRSDIFIGFYGQRYGWHGAKDEKLQQNIENALKRYPWLKTVRDRSVTEMEFYHGHLNSPGNIPAIMAFRDKAFDEAERIKAEKNKDTRTALKFTAESPEATKFLENLKDRVVKTENKCLALNTNYSTPQEGAKIVFELVKKHIENVLLKAQKSISKRNMDLAFHDAYMMSRMSVYVGGKEHEKTLDLALTKGQNVLITGSAGTGKGALLSHWLKSLQTRKTKHALIYHFVGCSSDSASIADLLRRLTEEINQAVGDVKKSKTKSLEEMDDELKPKSTDLTDLYREFELTLNKAAVKDKILIAIDGLGKVENVSRTSKTLFWLPAELPANVTVVGTCRDQDTIVIEELMTRGYKQLKISELTKGEREEMCKQLLSHNSKELSKSQMKKIVDTKQAGNPLYLKTVVSELCTFGYYRELDEKIDQLTSCKSVKELFQVFIRRLEADYITDMKKGNIIEQVLCSIRVSRKGLSEKELMSMYDIPSHEWSPLFFAMQHVVVEMAGLLKFGFKELQDAVDDKYMKDKNTKLKYQKIVANHFQSQREKEDHHIQMDDPSVVRISEELPWVLQDMGDKKQLMEVLGDLSIFGRLFLDQEFDLIELWRSTDLPGDDIGEIYLKTIQNKANTFLKKTGSGDEYRKMVTLTLVSYLNALSYFMEMAHYRTAQEKVLMTQLKLMNDSLTLLDKDFKERNLAMIKIKLAYLYTDTGRYAEAEALHQEVLGSRQQLLAKAKNDFEKEVALKGLGSSYHGIAMLYSKLDKISEAIEFYTKAMEVQKQVKDEVEVADSLHNLGVMYMKVGKYEQALDLCTRSMKIYEDLYFANLPPVIGVMIGNIAVCYRNLGKEDEAEKMYKKAIDISERAVGRQHPHVALALMNIGTLEINRQHYEQAEVYLRECVDIFDKCETLANDVDYYRSHEKFVYVLMKVKQVDEAVGHFQKMFQIAKNENFMSSCWHPVYVCVLDCLIANKQFKFAHDVVLALLATGSAPDKCYLQYDAICTGLKQKPKPEYSVDAAIKKHPGSLGLLRHVMENIFIPSESLEKILETIEEVESKRKIGADLYGTVAFWCDEAKKPDLATAVLVKAVKMFPNETNFVCSLANKLYDKQKYVEGMEYSGKLCLLEPNNPNHFMMHGDMAIRTQNMPEARKTFNDMLVKFAKNEEVASQARKALDMIDALEKKGALAKK